MEFEWDEAKRLKNMLKHGVDFADADEFEFDTAQIEADTRRDYGEERYVAYGFVGDRVYVMTYTKREGRTRIINFRKANKRETIKYADRS